MLHSVSILQGDFKGYIQIPRHYAAASSHVDIAELLIAKSTDHNASAKVLYRCLRTINGKSHVRFLLKSIGSTALGFLGGWLGGLIGFSTGFCISLVFSTMGWYLTKYICDECLPY